MDLQELKENLKTVIDLQAEVKDLKKGNRHTYSLREYVDQFRDRLINIDHGDRDRFFWPMHIASTRLDDLSNLTDAEIDSRFSTTKTKLLSIMNRYIKDLQHEFYIHDSGLNSTR
jgi:hypothetical protein